MRILSKFQDYYDSVNAWGVDETLTFVRGQKATRLNDLSEETQELILKASSAPQPQPVTSRRKEFWEPKVDKVVIFFCGKMYPAWNIYGKWCLSVEQISKAFRDLTYWTGTPYAEAKTSYFELKRREPYIRLFEEGEEKERKKGPWVSRSYVAQFTRSDVQKCIEAFEANSRDLTAAFVEIGAPYFVLRYNLAGYTEVYTNPILKDHGFPAFKDAFSTYQEIAQFLGGVMPRESVQQVEISDTSMRDKKGFDDMSFKNTAPGTRKARRKENRKRKRQNE